MRLGVEAGGEVGVGKRAFADMDVEMGRGTRLLLLAASARLAWAEPACFWVYKCTPIIIVEKLYLYITHVYLTLHL
jgi:hypothetical protein